MHKAKVAGAVLMALAAVACHKRTASIAKPPASADNASISTTPPATSDDSGGNALRREEAIRATSASLTISISFGFDEYDLDVEARSILDQKIQILTSNPDVRIRATGHADERGSDEYNLALGQRRGAAAKRYLTQNGISADRIEVDSAGEERSTCYERTESCWERNRRVQFVLISGRVVAPLE